MADEVRLIDIVEEFISGDWGEESATEDNPCAVSCVRGADIVPISNSRFENIPVRYISAASFKNRRLSEGDIIIEKSGGSPTQSTGRTVYVSQKLVEAKKNIVCSNFCQAFRIKDGWNPLYVYYYLQVVYNSGVFFNFEGKTSGLKNLILDSAFQSITIKKVPLEEQDRVASLLSLIDDKIAANHAINDYLEAMAKQLYDYWFVQFDFPNDSGLPYRNTGGKMRWDSSLRKSIPTNWSSATIESLCSRIQSGGTPATSNKSYYCGTNAWYSTQELTDKWLIDSIKHISDEALENSSAKLFEKDTVVIAIYASPTVGRLGLLSSEGAFNQACCGLVVGNTISKEYLFLTLKANRKQLNTLADGTAQKNLNVGKVKEFKILVPEQRVMKEWTEHVTPLFEELLNNEKQIKELYAHRDSILLLLMNGQVSVKQLNNHLSAF